MLLAKTCGITIPELRLITIGDKDVLLVKRFDRLKTAMGYQRFGFLSALSLMEWDERDRTQWSYPALADRMRATVLAQPRQLKELFRRMLFNVLCRNTDDHPRNHGFLWSEQGLALSPAYDIVPTPTRFGVGTDFSLSMALGNRGREATLVNAMSLSARFGVTYDEARLIGEDMKIRVGSWEELFAAQDVSPAELEAIKACFMAAFAEI
jgi:serine/threonine-protein kinase HipA